MTLTNLDVIEKWLSIAEKGTVLLAGLVAAIKLQVFGLLKDDYRTEIQSDCQTSKNPFVWADYTITNIGDLPFVVRCVRLSLCCAKEEAGGHLVPDREKPLAPTTFLAEDEQQAIAIARFDPTKDHFKKIGTLGYLGKGERTIFTLRCHIKGELPEVFFVVGESWRSTWFRHKPRHSFFNDMHVRESAKANRPKAISRGATGR